MTARRWARLLTGAVAVLALAGAAAPPSVIGSVAALRNQVDVRAAKAAQPRPAVLRQRMALGDQVQTGERSHMQLLLLDRSSFTVGQNARVTIDRFVYDPGGGSFSATLAKGALRFMSGGRHGKDGASIRTPVATIGIRGTIVDAVVGEAAIGIARREPAVGSSVVSDPQSASLIVLRGPGPRDSRPGAISVTAGGRTVDLDRPLLAVYVPGPDRAPIGPFVISLPGQAVLNDLILPRLEPRLPASSDWRDFPPSRDEPGLPFPGRRLPPEFSSDGEGARAPIPGIPLELPVGRSSADPAYPAQAPGGPSQSGGPSAAPPPPPPAPAPAPTSPPPTQSSPPPPSTAPTGGPLTGYDN